MDPIYIYGIAAGSIILAFFLYSAFASISNWFQDRTLFYIFKYLIYPTLFRRRRFVAPFTRWQILWTSIYWLCTSAYNIVGVSSLPQAGSRAGSLAALHLIPLLFSNRLSFAADMLGLSLQNYLGLHRSIGIMAFLQALIHTILFLINNALSLQDVPQFFGFLVSKIVFTCGSVS